MKILYQFLYAQAPFPRAGLWRVRQTQREGGASACRTAAQAMRQSGGRRGGKKWMRDFAISMRVFYVFSLVESMRREYNKKTIPKRDAANGDGKEDAWEPSGITTERSARSNR